MINKIDAIFSRSKRYIDVERVNMNKNTNLKVSPNENTPMKSNKNPRKKITLIMNKAV